MYRRFYKVTKLLLLIAFIFTAGSVCLDHKGYDLQQNHSHSEEQVTLSQTSESDCCTSKKPTITNIKIRESNLVSLSQIKNFTTPVTIAPRLVLSAPKPGWSVEKRTVLPLAQHEFSVVFRS